MYIAISVKTLKSTLVKHTSFIFHEALARWKVIWIASLTQFFYLASTRKSPGNKSDTTKCRIRLLSERWRKKRIWSLEGGLDEFRIAEGKNNYVSDIMMAVRYSGRTRWQKCDIMQPPMVFAFRSRPVFSVRILFSSALWSTPKNPVHNYNIYAGRIASFFLNFRGKSAFFRVWKTAPSYFHKNVIFMYTAFVSVFVMKNENKKRAMLRRGWIFFNN